MLNIFKNFEDFLWRHEEELRPNSLIGCELLDIYYNSETIKFYACTNDGQHLTDSILAPEIFELYETIFA